MYIAALHCTRPDCAAPYSSVQCSIVQQCTEVYSNVQYSSVQQCTEVYSNVQYSIVQQCTAVFKTVLDPLASIDSGSFILVLGGTSYQG